ncbi:hypothetical protein CHS0354_033541 [Potamilus streckersoni]|uniref:Uncharacterized protein n=1 Tax=Potamilus streckersoni TaxID=2493646 RepID=A0AAE0T0K9_9BIVA|nr:hypothetical protein CHS0354_033541 [Potamilus streckersoni]
MVQDRLMDGWVGLSQNGRDTKELIAGQVVKLSQRSTKSIDSCTGYYPIRAWYKKELIAGQLVMLSERGTKLIDI